MKTRILSCLIIVTFFISSALVAQPGVKGKQWEQNRGQKEMMQKRFAESKKMHQKFFTDEQQETMKGLRLETVKKVKPLKNELREVMAHQKTLTTADKADLKAINKNIDKMSDIKSEIAKVMAAQHQEVRSLLTEEQLIRFDSMKKRHGVNRGNQFMRQDRNRRGQTQFRKGA